MSLHETHDLHKLHLHESTTYSVVLVRSAIKRAILIGYEKQIISADSTQRAIDALRLWGA